MYWCIWCWRKFKPAPFDCAMYSNSVHFVFFLRVFLIVIEDLETYALILYKLSKLLHLYKLLRLLHLFLTGIKYKSFFQSLSFFCRSFGEKPRYRSWQSNQQAEIEIQIIYRWIWHWCCMRLLRNISILNFLHSILSVSILLVNNTCFTRFM